MFDLSGGFAYLEHARESQYGFSCSDNNFYYIESFKWKGDDIYLYAFIWNAVVCVINSSNTFSFQVFTVFLLTEYIW